MGTIWRNLPIKIRWAGWESNTEILGRHGWEAHVEDRRPSERWGQEARIVLRHRKFNCTMVTHPVEMPSHYERDRIQFMFSEVGAPVAIVDIFGRQIQLRVSGEPHYMLVDTDPQMQFMEEIKDLDELLWFAPKEEKEIVVVDESVPELMNRILEMQQPEKQRYYEQRMREKKRVEKQVHAKLVTIAS